MFVIIDFEVVQFVSKIRRCPEERVVEKFSTHGSDQSLDERVGQGNMGDCFNFLDFEGTQVSLPSVGLKDRVVIGAQFFRYKLVNRCFIVQAANVAAVDGLRLNGEADEPAGTLVKNDHDPMGSEAHGFASK